MVLNISNFADNDNKKYQPEQIIKWGKGEVHVDEKLIAPNKEWTRFSLRSPITKTGQIARANKIPSININNNYKDFNLYMRRINNKGWKDLRVEVFKHLNDDELVKKYIDLNILKSMFWIHGSLGMGTIKSNIQSEKNILENGFGKYIKTADEENKIERFNYIYDYIDSITYDYFKAIYQNYIGDLPKNFNNWKPTEEDVKKIHDKIEKEIGQDKKKFNDLDKIKTDHNKGFNLWNEPHIDIPKRFVIKEEDNNYKFKNALTNMGNIATYQKVKSLRLLNNKEKTDARYEVDLKNEKNKFYKK